MSFGIVELAYTIIDKPNSVPPVLNKLALALGLVAGAFAVATIVLTVYKVNDDALIKECESKLDNADLDTTVTPSDTTTTTTTPKPDEVRTNKS